MQLISDAIAVFGSRIGMAIQPGAQKAYVIRFGEHPGIPLDIQAGLQINGKTYLLPLSSTGFPFSFVEQDMMHTAFNLTGIIAEHGIQVDFTVRIPFHPGDLLTSTLPVLFLTMKVKRLKGDFRWTRQKEDEYIAGTLILKLGGSAFNVELSNERTYDICYKAFAPYPAEDGTYAEDNQPAIRKSVYVKDKLHVSRGNCSEEKISYSFNLTQGESVVGIEAIWASWDEPLMAVYGESASFWYAKDFTDIESVVAYAANNRKKLCDLSKEFDRLCDEHKLGSAFSHLSAYAFHSWLINTWMVRRPNGEPWYAVWEGSCYFTSTVDVEYSQTPFYLLVWPQLLKFELKQWKHFIHIPEDTRLCGRYLSHDTGQFLNCGLQYYPHQMEVEENCNYILMACAYWKRTGDEKLRSELRGIIINLMDYIVSTDLQGTGVPSTGCSNTIDDASPAIQFGNQQVYLGIKAVAALTAGVSMIDGMNSDVYKDFCNRALNTIKNKGWLEDHFAVNCASSAKGLVDPWTGKELHGVLNGWDASHIFSSNGLFLLDMIGMSIDISKDMIVKDIQTALKRTLTKYGSRHTDFISSEVGQLNAGLTGASNRVGWLSMNFLRDSAALYRGIDLLHLLQQYWDWLCTVNTQEITLFFETFYGNNLNFYPRGLALFALYDAVAGHTLDVTKGIEKWEGFHYTGISRAGLNRGGYSF